MKNLPDIMYKFFKFFIDPFDINSFRRDNDRFYKEMTEYTVSIENKLDAVYRNMAEIEHLKSKYEQELIEVKKDVDMYCLSINSFGDAIDDMAWIKWVDGTYSWCNNNLVNTLLFSGSVSNTIGKTDNHFGKLAVKQFGEDRHNFGKYCEGSDAIVIECGVTKKFLEFGFSGGVPLVLDVIKNPIIKNGKVVATVGVARNMTESVFKILDIINSSNDESAVAELRNLLGKYLYLGESSSKGLCDFYWEVKNGRD